MADNPQEQETKQVKFNTGIDKGKRIGKLREGCHDARIKSAYDTWENCLMGLRSEMFAKFTDHENHKCNVFDTLIAGVKQRIIKDVRIFDALYDYELYLGYLEDVHNFGMPDKPSQTEATDV